MKRKNLKKFVNDPGIYNLRGNQCTSVATGCMNRAGIYIKSDNLNIERTGKFYIPNALRASLSIWSEEGSNNPIVIKQSSFTVGK